MQARGFLPQQIQIGDQVDHVEIVKIVEERGAEVTQWILAVTASQFRARGKFVIAVSSPCNKHLAVW